MSSCLDRLFPLRLPATQVLELGVGNENTARQVDAIFGHVPIILSLLRRQFQPSCGQIRQVPTVTGFSLYRVGRAGTKMLSFIFAKTKNGRFSKFLFRENFRLTVHFRENFRSLANLCEIFSFQENSAKTFVFWDIFPIFWIIARAKTHLHVNCCNFQQELRSRDRNRNNLIKIILNFFYNNYEEGSGKVPIQISFILAEPWLQKATDETKQNIHLTKKI